jgi:predicted SnoaL-like aldol condensation-catalyzing enzyme
MNISEKIKVMKYYKTHRLLVEGNFVLAVNEGDHHGIHSSFYDLFRIESDQIVEHWDTTEKVPPKSDWKNENGKF